MSRAFVINGDEWGFCTERQMRCPGANEDGTCMRPSCTEVPAWEQPKRDIRAERLRKMTELQEQEDKAKPDEKTPVKTTPGEAAPAKPWVTFRSAAGKAAKTGAKPTAKPASAGNSVKSIWKPVPVKRPQKWK